MPIKIAIIGAGSVGFTRTMVRDILCIPELQDSLFAFHDISEKNLDMVLKLVQRDIAHNGIPAQAVGLLNRREAIEGAKYIFSFVRVGGLEAFQTDVDVPLQYGVDQCVGDTLGPGGIMYAQRGIPVLLDFCKDIREAAAPDALFLNYSNPMAMLTWACVEHGGVNTVGLCHGVIHGHHQIAEVNGLKQSEVDIICAGINHQTWYVHASHQGRDLLPGLLQAFEKHTEYSKTEKVRIDMLRRFGFYSTESNGHLSEYVPWYRKRPHEIPQWIDTSCWIHGETGGYLRICKEGRNWFEHDFPNWMKEPPFDYTSDKRGQEHGSFIIEALETGRPYRGHFNRQNKGCISNLPDDCIIEAPGYADRTGIHMLPVGDLPLGCAAVCSASVSVQRLAVKAAVSGDANVLKQAMMMDPLTGAVCNPAEIWQMADDMLIAQAEWLPQYSQAITAARLRSMGERLPTDLGYRGAVRIAEKTVDQMAADREKVNKKLNDPDKAQVAPKT